MSRSNKNTRKLAFPDPIYNNRQITKLINRVMKDGKKTTAAREVYGALDIIKEKTNQDPIPVFESALAQITPKVEVRSRRIGGAAYQVPTPVRGVRASSLTLRWLVTEARKRPNKEFHTFAGKLAAELLAASKGEGGAVQKKLTAHKQAEANKAFSHFRF